jgi:hypothetical protein
MACGLPVISPEGVSDDYKDIIELNLGVVFSREASSISIAKEVMVYFQKNSAEEIRKSVRNYVRSKRDIEVGKKLLVDIFDEIN